MQWQNVDKDVVEVTVLGDDESSTKMSGGDVDVTPYLYSRNTIGLGNHNSKSQNRSRIVVRWGMPWGWRSLGAGDRSGYAEA